MADVTGLPSMPTTVNLGEGAAPQGDPLELMQGTAREAINSVSKNILPNDKEKLEFKKYVLKKLKKNIDKFNELDAKVAKKAEEETTKADEESDSKGDKKEEDPFADIFDEEGDDKPDETTQEKAKIAQEFVSGLKMSKEKFLKEVRIKREKQQAKVDEKNMEEILGKLDEV